METIKLIYRDVDFSVGYRLSVSIGGFLGIGTPGHAAKIMAAEREGESAVAPLAWRCIGWLLSR